VFHLFDCDLFEYSAIPKLAYVTVKYSFSTKSNEDSLL